MDYFKKNISAIAVIGMLLMVLVMYQATAHTLYELWLVSNNVTYTHGSLLLVVCTYFFYKHWKQVGAIQISPSNLGFVLLFFVSIFWFLMELADVVIATQVLFPIIILLGIWTLFGYRMAREFLFPVMLIICAIPVWEVINEGWLQKITAIGVSNMLDIAGITNYRENVQIYISVGTFRVAENCSGMRQLVAAITIAVIYAYVNHFRVIGMVAYIFAAVLLSILVNMVRIFIVVVSGQLTNMQHYFVREDHVTLGWVLFGIGIFIFIYFSNRIFNEEYTEKKSTHDLAGKTTNKAVATKALILLVIGLGVGPALAQFYTGQTEHKIDKYSFPKKIEKWELLAKSTYDYIPNFVAARNKYSSVYMQENKEVYCHISYYARQEQGNELISTLNRISDEKTWVTKNKAKYSFILNNKKVHVDEIVVTSLSGSKKLIWHWYYLTGKKTNSRIMTKILSVWGVLINRTESASFLVAMDVDSNIDNTRKTLEAFLNDSLTTLETSINRMSEVNE